MGIRYPRGLSQFLFHPGDLKGADPRQMFPPSCWGHCHHILEQAVSHRAWLEKEREALLTMETGFLGKGHIVDVAVIRTP